MTNYLIGTVRPFTSDNTQMAEKAVRRLNSISEVTSITEICVRKQSGYWEDKASSFGLLDPGTKWMRRVVSQLASRAKLNRNSHLEKNDKSTPYMFGKIMGLGYIWIFRREGWFYKHTWKEIKWNSKCLGPETSHWNIFRNFQPSMSSP